MKSGSKEGKGGGVKGSGINAGFFKDAKVEILTDRHKDDKHQKKQNIMSDPGLYCFISMAHFHGIPADPEQIAHALAIDPREGMSEGDMLRAAKSLKLKARAALVKASHLGKLPLPAIIGHEKETFAILAQIHDGKYLVALPDT